MQQEIPPPSDDQSNAWRQQLDLSGENYGFGPVDAQQQPKRSSRTCLLAVIALVVGCSLICVCGGFFAYQARELVLVSFYHQVLSDQNLNALELNVICGNNSQAEVFHQAFVEKYPQDTKITIKQSEIDDDTNQVKIVGTLEYEGQTSDYIAVYTIDPDGDFLYVMGCISEIHQIEPPLVPLLG